MSFGIGFLGGGGGGFSGSSTAVSGAPLSLHVPFQAGDFYVKSAGAGQGSRTDTLLLAGAAIFALALYKKR